MACASRRNTDGRDGSRPQLARPIIEIRDFLRKVYRRDRQELTVLDGIDLEVPDGAFEALMGPSGSGKTDAAEPDRGIDAPTSGSIRVAGEEIARLSEDRRAQWRARTIDSSSSSTT